MDYAQHDAYLDDQMPVPVGNPDVHHSLSRQRQRQQEREQHHSHHLQDGGGSRVLQSPSLSTIQHHHADPSTPMYNRPPQHAPQQPQPTSAPLASTATKESYLREALLFYERGDFELAKNVLVDHVFQTAGGTTGQQHIPVHPMLFAESLLLLGNIHAAQGDMEACDRRYSECYEIIQDEYCGVHNNKGSKHIGLAIVLINHSTVLIRRWEALNHLSLSQVISSQQSGSATFPSRSSSAATAPLTRMPTTTADGGSNSHVRVSTAPATSGLASLGMLAAGLGLGAQDDTGAASSPMKLINEALSMLKSAHSIVENTLGADRLVLADCLHNMGCCHQIMGGASVEALECFMRSLKIRERVPEGGGGGDNEPYDRSISNTTAYSGRVENMSRFQLTAMCVSSASTSSLKIAATLEHIAMVLFHLHTPEHPNTGRLKQSENIMKTVAGTRKRVLGPLSVGYAEALFNLATVESELGLKRNAHTNFRTCHSIRSKAFGDQHELTLLAQLMTMATKVWKGAH